MNHNTTGAALPPSFAWEPSQRYPDPLVKIVDPGFARYRLNLAKVERIATGMRWAEGPVWFGDVRCLLWSDIPNNRMMKWEEETGVVSVFRKPSNFANGNTRDRLDDVVDGGTRLSNKRKLVDAGPGTPDGMRCDVDGNLWVGWGMGQEGLDGVSIFNPEGQFIGRINLPERCANLCFGGLQRNRLFMASSTSLYSLYVNTQGATGG